MLLDVRAPWEYEICHLDKSINIAMSGIPSAIGELDPEKETVVVCHHGVRSLQIATYLEDQGFKQVSSLEGGIDAWAKFIDQTMPQY